MSSDKATRYFRYTAMLAALAAPLGTASANNDHERKQRDATHSSPIAITGDDKFVWSVNPDNDSVSVFRVAKDHNRKVAEIAVGKEPWCVAIKPGRDKRDGDRKWWWHDRDDDAKVYVANMVSGTVSVIDAQKYKVVDTIKVGTEPFGCAISPDGRRLYVANQSSEDVSVIDTKRDKVVKTIERVGSSRTASPSPPTARRCTSRNCCPSARRRTRRVRARRPKAPTTAASAASR